MGVRVFVPVHRFAAQSCMQNVGSMKLMGIAGCRRARQRDIGVIGIILRTANSLGTNQSCHSSISSFGLTTSAHYSQVEDLGLLPI